MSRTVLVAVTSAALLFAGETFTQRQREFWSFQKVKPQTPPPVKEARWVRTPIDRFILNRLDRERVTPSPMADPTTLARRVSLDLTGLPPTPEEVDAFMDDPSATAYETLVDRLLASPAFGERWARHWMDLARYSDSEGYEKDLVRPNAWRWRQAGQTA